MKHTGLFIVLSLVLLCAAPLQAKRVKQILHVEKETKDEVKKRKRGAECVVICMTDSTEGDGGVSLLREKLKECSYAGYEKEANSNIESFILLNPGDTEILGFRVRIDYLDMKGRMIHSRDIEESGIVPPGEARRFDVKSWDKQHTYYYHLGNSPKRVATPFRVKFTPLEFWVK